MSIKNNIRKGDLLFRYGGDEFILLIPGSNKKETSQLMNRLESHKDKNPGSILRFSYGIASYPEDGDSTEKLIEMSDF